MVCSSKGERHADKKHGLCGCVSMELGQQEQRNRHNHSRRDPGPENVREHRCFRHRRGATESRVISPPHRGRAERLSSWLGQARCPLSHHRLEW